MFLQIMPILTICWNDEFISFPDLMKKFFINNFSFCDPFSCQISFVYMTIYRPNYFKWFQNTEYYKNYGMTWCVFPTRYRIRICWVNSCLIRNKYHCTGLKWPCMPWIHPTYLGLKGGNQFFRRRLLREECYCIKLFLAIHNIVNIVD